MLYIGIDPGLSGGWAAVTESQQVVYLCRWNEELSMLEVSERDSVWGSEVVAIVENQRAIKGAASSSTFKLAENFGLWQGWLSALRIRREYVWPKKWQSTLGIRFPKNSTHAQRKRITKQKAQQLYPQVDGITHATADALLIAEYCRREWR